MRYVLHQKPRYVPPPVSDRSAVSIRRKTCLYSWYQTALVDTPLPYAALINRNVEYPLVWYPFSLAQSRTIVGSPWVHFKLTFEYGWTTYLRITATRITGTGFSSAIRSLPAYDPNVTVGDVLSIMAQLSSEVQSVTPIPASIGQSDTPYAPDDFGAELFNYGAYTTHAQIPDAIVPGDQANLSDASFPDLSSYDPSSKIYLLGERRYTIPIGPCRIDSNVHSMHVTTTGSYLWSTFLADVLASDLSGYAFEDLVTPTVVSGSVSVNAILGSYWGKELLASRGGRYITKPGVDVMDLLVETVAQGITLTFTSRRNFVDPITGRNEVDDAGDVVNVWDITPELTPVEGGGTAVVRLALPAEGTSVWLTKLTATQ